MVRELLALLIPLLACAVNGPVQVVAYRVGRAGHYRSIALGFALGFVALLALSLGLLGWSTDLSDLGLHLTNAVIYTVLGYVYFHFNNMGESARRVRLLRELCEADGGLTRAELLERYDAREMIERRLDRLIEGGQLVEREGRLHAGQGAVLGMQRLVALAKWIVFRGESELDRHDVSL